MKTLIKLVNGKEVSRKDNYLDLERATNAGNSWLRDCTVHAVIREDRTISIIDTI